jgi:hypothetical protein
MGFTASGLPRKSLCSHVREDIRLELLPKNALYPVVGPAMCSKHAGFEVYILMTRVFMVLHFDWSALRCIALRCDRWQPCVKCHLSRLRAFRGRNEGHSMDLLHESETQA